MMGYQEVESISDFMRWVKDTLPVEAEQVRHALFYRGHADEHYELQPGVYRTDTGKSHRNDESRMYHEMLRRDPAAFAEDKTVFERLARMQHYGLPTRLLDLTQNPLVALFFACEGQTEKDGQVMFFHMPQRDVVHQESLSELILAGVECSLDFKDLGHKICKQLRERLFSENQNNAEYLEFNDDYHNLLSKCIGILDDSMSRSHDFLVACGALQLVSDEYSHLYKRWDEKFSKRIFDSNELKEKLIFRNAEVFLRDFHKRLEQWKFDIMSNLCKQMRVNFYRSYPPLHEFLSGMTWFNFVFPPMNNERLRRQRGAFLVYPPVKSELWTIEHFKKPEVVRIKAQAKEALLKDLTNQGITRSYLFPELNEQAKDICTLYPRADE